MKKLLFSIMIVLIAIACNEPLTVTGKPNQQDATSGTLGSAGVTNHLPPTDTARKPADTTRHN